MSDHNEIERRYNETHGKLGQLYIQRINVVKQLKKIDAEITKAHEDVKHQLRAYEAEESK